MLRSVIWVLLAFSGKGMGTMLPRALRTNASCSSSKEESWVWMYNAQQQSPCLTAAYVMGPCVSESKCLDCTPFYRWRIILTAWKIILCQPSMALMNTRLTRPLLASARGMFLSSSLAVMLILLNYSSWAAYNLLSACTLCQDFQSSIPSYVW